MKMWLRHGALGLLLAAALLAQTGEPGRPDYPDDSQQKDVKLPNGKSQRDEILKAERKQNLKDAAQLVQFAQELQQELEKNDRFVLPLSALKKADDIEKLAHKIRSRLRH